MPDNTSDPQKYAYIDALRGLAILGVLMIHISYLNGNTFTEWRILTESGRYGVQLFYLVSAFTLIASLHTRREENSTRYFFLRRLFRIAPAFYVAMVIHSLAQTVDTAMWAPNGITWQTVLATLTFAHGVHPYWINAIVPGGWSVAIEFSFYCLLPFIVRWITTLERAIMAMIGSVAFALISNLVHGLFFDHSDNLLKSHAYYWLPNQLPVFMLGVLLFFLLPYLQALKAHPRAFAIASGLLLIGWFILPKTNVRLFTTHIYTGLGFGLLTAALAIYPFGLLVNRATVGLGKISYSLYLVHTLIISMLVQISGFFNLHRILPPSVWHLVMAVAVLSLSIVVAIVMYRYIEMPGIELGKALIGWLKQRQPISRNYRSAVQMIFTSGPK